uniref:Uncharacterized protein n=1 Tax=Parascaris univalens TaxID=6257 RepID=A0A915A721_PARUN
VRSPQRVRLDRMTDLVTLIIALIVIGISLYIYKQYFPVSWPSFLSLGQVWSLRYGNEHILINAKCFKAVFSCQRHMVVQVSI